MSDSKAANSKGKSLLTASEETQIAASLDSFAIISSTDARGVINYVNDLFCEISGYSREELIGQRHRVVNSGFHPKEFFSEMWSTIRSGRIWQGEIQNKKKNGEIYWVRSYIVPLLDTAGVPLRYISYRMDITKEKLEHAELEAERIRSIHLGRLSSLGKMASNVAHEINNPLTVISGSLDMIRASLLRTKDMPEVASLISRQLETDIARAERALKQVDRITKIISGLRRFSRSDDSSGRETTELSAIYHSVSELCSEKIRKYQVSILFEPNNLALDCNSIQIEQVLVNLIGNSIDAIRSREERWIKVSAQECPSADQIEIHVTDSGHGIPAEIVPRLTEPFFTTKGPEQGTGLGLSITRTIIQQHAGTFYYDPTSANTRFVIRLPRVKAQSPASRQAA